MDIKKYRKEYYLKNKERLKQYQRWYYTRNKNVSLSDKKEKPVFNIIRKDVIIHFE
tara:strand:+ start:7380 stop:7547 length:168 start_codon:yes stop_codon:yes gene_type:complete